MKRMKTQRESIVDRLMSEYECDCRDDPGYTKPDYVTPRFAHIADGPETRNLYTEETVEPHDGYVPERWTSVVVWDLEADAEVPTSTATEGKDDED